MIEVYLWEPVSHSARVLICLHEIGAKFESHYVDLLAFEQFSPEFLDMNPLGLVPVVRHHGAVLTESALINEYLAESFPEAGLAPKDAFGWYETQIWSKYIDYNLSSSLSTLGCRKYLVPELQNEKSEELLARIDAIPVIERRAGWRLAASGAYDEGIIGNSQRKVALVVARMEQRLAAADWLVGTSYSIADIDTYAMVASLQDLAPGLIDREASPRTLGWLDRIAARPAVSAVLTQHSRRPGQPLFAPGPEHSRWG